MNEYAYSAKLVFKVTGVPKEHGRWLCEERIIRSSDLLMNYKI